MLILYGPSIQQFTVLLCLVRPRQGLNRGPSAPMVCAVPNELTWKTISFNIYIERVCHCDQSYVELPVYDNMIRT